MKINIFKTHKESSKAAAKVIANIIKEKPNAILGLATGSSPIMMYEELISQYSKKEISFKNITTFNLDEYIGLDQSHPKSYRYFMNQTFFNHIDINKENTFVPSGVGDVKKTSQKYEGMLIKNPIDIQVLGIGTNAHIGFNEPGSSFDSLTREVELTPQTIEANKRFFNSPSQVPKTAISMGIASIFRAKKIILIASGKNKAQAIKDTVEAHPNPKIPSSILQNHPDVELFIDQEAASLLKK